MTALKRTEQWRWLCYFDSESSLDTETDKTQIIHTPHLICDTWVDRANKTRQERDYEGPGLCERFYGDLAASVHPHTTLYLMAHNVGYDLLATGAFVEMAKFGWKVDSLYEKGFTYILRWVGPEGRRIVALSSTQFWTSPLRDVAKHFGLEKLESIGHATADFEQLRIYCRRDVEIVETAMEWLQSYIFDNDLGSMAVTLPSLSSKIFRHKFMTTPPEIHNYEPALILERASYHGGRTEAWFLGKMTERIYKLDVNSLYPAVMRDFEHPYKLERLYPQGSVELLNEILKVDQFFIADITVKNLKEPKIPLFRDKLLFPCGTFKTVITSHEYRLLDPCEVGEVRAVAMYNSKPLFRDFIGFFYAEREKAKREGKKAVDVLLKGIMNAHYGKYGQKTTEWVRVGDAPPDLVKQEEFVLPDGTTRMMRCFGGSTWINDGSVMESFESFPAIASSVTSAARAVLWNYIKAAGLDNVFYMDTDSLFVNQTGYDRLKRKGIIDDFKLGAMKLEKVADEIEIFGPKNYRFGDERRFKGIPRDAKTVVDENGEVKAVVWTWPKIASWLRSGTLDHFANRSVLKRVTAAPYDKGTRTGSGRVIPIVLNEELLAEP